MVSKSRSKVRAKVPINENPVLIDRVLKVLQKEIVSKLKWVEVAFGRSYPRVNSEARIIGSYPAAYLGGGEFESLLPNDTMKGFSWFDIYDPQEVKSIGGGRPELTFEGALVFWYRVDKIYADNSALLGTEEIKKSVLKMLMSPSLYIEGGSVRVVSVNERIENIYKGYNLKGLEPRFLEYPYAGLRIEMEFKIEELCMK